MPGKVLIIEDDPTSLRLIEYALKQRGYQVLATVNGLEGRAGPGYPGYHAARY